MSMRFADFFKISLKHAVYCRPFLVLLSNHPSFIYLWCIVISALTSRAVALALVLALRDLVLGLGLDLEGRGLGLEGLGLGLAILSLTTSLENT